MRVRSNKLYVPVTSFINKDRKKEERGSAQNSYASPDKSFTAKFKALLKIENKPKTKNIFFK